MECTYVWMYLILELCFGAFICLIVLNFEWQWVLAPWVWIQCLSYFLLSPFLMRVIWTNYPVNNILLQDSCVEGVMSLSGFVGYFFSFLYLKCHSGEVKDMQALIWKTPQDMISLGGNGHNKTDLTRTLLRERKQKVCWIEVNNMNQFSYRVTAAYCRSEYTTLKIHCRTAFILCNFQIHCRIHLYYTTLQI